MSDEKDLTPQPPSLRGKGEQKAPLPRGRGWGGVLSLTPQPPSLTGRGEFGRGRPADPWYVRYALVGLTLGIVGILILVPLMSVFAQATAKGLGVYWKSLVADPDTRHAIFLTLMVAPVAVAMNVVGGVAAAWAIARFRFPGRSVLITLIDLPFSVSPVVAGLLFVLIFGLQTPLGQWLRDHGYQVIFAPPGSCWQPRSSLSRSWPAN